MLKICVCLTKLYFNPAPLIHGLSRVLRFLPAAKPAGLWLANVTLLLVDTWLLGALDTFICMLAQVGELARIKYDVS